MNSKEKKTAILYFALSQREERKHKSFFYHTTTHQSLTDHFKGVFKRSGLDFFHYSEKEQEGETFGERFTNAITSIYDKGYQSVITVGNDSPGLNLHHIRKAIEALEAHKFILGPSLDGGFYLMGLRKEYFNKNQFVNFSWNTSKLSTEIKESISEYTQGYVQLNYLGDIDSAIDLKNIIASLGVRKKKLRKLLQHYLIIKDHLFWYLEKSVFAFVLRQSYNKGSPIL